MSYLLYTGITSPLVQFEFINLLSLDAPIFGNLHISLTNIGLYLTLGALAIFTLKILATRLYPRFSPHFYSDIVLKRLYLAYLGLKSAFLFFCSWVKPCTCDEINIIKLNAVLLILAALVADTNECIHMSNWCDHAIHIWENFMRNYPNGEDLWLESDTYNKVIETFDKEGLVFNDEEPLDDNLEIYQRVLEARYDNHVEKTIQRLNELNETIPRGPRLGETGILSHIAPFPRS